MGIAIRLECEEIINLLSAYGAIVGVLIYWWKKIDLFICLFTLGPSDTHNSTGIARLYTYFLPSKC
jgi:hypothetical protein